MINYTKYILSILFIFTMCTIKNSTAQTRNKIDSLEQKLEYTKDSSKIDILIKLCWELRNSKIQKSIKYGLEAIELAQQYNDYINLTKANSFVGVAYRNLGNYPEAYDFYYKGLNLAKKHKLTTQEGYAYINIGNLFIYQENYPKAIDNFNKALSIAKEINNKNMNAYCNLNLGRVYIETNNYNKALIYLKKALSIRKEINDISGQSVCYNYIGDTYSKLNKCKLSQDNYENAMNIAEINSDKNLLCSIYDKLSNIYLDKKNITKATLYANRNLKTALEVGTILRIKNAYHTMAQIEKYNHNYEAATRYYDLVINYKDSLRYRQLAEKISYIEFLNNQHEYEQKLKNQQLSYNSKIHKQKQFINYSIILTILLIIISFIIFMFFRIKQRANAILLAKNKQIVKARKEAEQANQLKSEFLANMSHEIRTPINAVLGFSEILSTKLENNTEYKSFINGIIKGGQDLIILINDILDLSKIEAGHLEIKPEIVNLRKLIEDIKQIFSINIKQKDLQFIINIDNEFPKIIMFDQTRIRQILFNLVGNAIKFTDSGFIEIKVKVIKYNISKNKIDFKLEVKDSGIGIRENQIDKIFEAFQQTEGQSTKYGGTGLGLAITKRLVEAMNGKITAESEPGVGSVFSTYYKNVDIPKIITAKNSEIEQLTNHNFKFYKPTILLIDNKKSNREVIKYILKNSNCIVREADNEEKAINLLKTYIPDLILINIEIPGISGYETTKKIKSQSKYASIPIIAITTLVTKEQEEKYDDIFDDYLKKPISTNNLIKSLIKFLPYNELSVDENTNTKNYSYFDEIELFKKGNGQFPKEFIEKYKNEFIPLFEDVREILDIEECKKFASLIIETSKEYKVEIFEKFGTELYNVTNNYQLSEIERLLHKFEKFEIIH